MNSLSQNNNTFVPYTMNYFSDSSSENLFCLRDNAAQLRNIYKPTPVDECHDYQSDEKNINNIWSKGTFHNRKLQTHELNLNIKANKMSWSSQNNNNNNNNNNISTVEDREVRQEETDKNFEMASGNSPTPESETTSPSHHARRPMNAFLIFCKKHRPVVRKKYPNLENRGVTRILGEWWALLDTTDKDPYKNLAKEYKDAFFSANPDFKWYKLPAPPLRTLSTRPPSTPKEPSPLPSPNHATSCESEFTPGKLADESQLGMLSSLLNVNSYSRKTSNFEFKTNLIVPFTDEAGVSEEKRCNNNNSDSPDKHVPFLESPPSITKTTSLPPKPLKKRVFIEHRNDNKDIARNIFNTNISNTYDTQGDTSNLREEQSYKLVQTEGDLNLELNNVTKQELVNKVVDSMFPDKNQNCAVPKNGLSSTKLIQKETRKSGRSCKGKLYAEFMVNGKLIKNKRDKRMSISEINKKIENELSNKIENKVEVTPKLDLGQTIKRLAERTHVNLDEFDQKPDRKEESFTRTRTISEASNDSYAKSVPNKFNLELRISELPSLNYDTYVQRKRESKKRKFTKTKSVASEPKYSKLQSTSNAGGKSLIGSKKRKNKQNITHLEKQVSQFENNFNDLSGLATLAEIAANKEKINQA